MGRQLQQTLFAKEYLFTFCQALRHSKPHWSLVHISMLLFLKVGLPTRLPQQALLLSGGSCSPEASWKKLSPGIHPERGLLFQREGVVLLSYKGDIPLGLQSQPVTAVAMNANIQGARLGVPDPVIQTVY